MTMPEGMNQAISYIEENLDGQIDYAEIARLAGMSQYHCVFDKS